ncbi:MAG TPA: hypothetical protein VF062_05080 [Candidatus Limnocylindrales bacterium]
MADTKWPDWTRTVQSNAAGRTHTRTVRITYPHRRPPSPEDERGIGVTLTVFTVTAGTFLGAGMLLMSLTLPDSDLGSIACLIISAGLLVYWWYISLGTLIRGVLNRRRRHVVRGVVVDRTDRWWEPYESQDFQLWYLAVDDGTRDEVTGWEVPPETHALLPVGTAVEAQVSGDGQYLYSITRA